MFSSPQQQQHQEEQEEEDQTNILGFCSFCVVRCFIKLKIKNFNKQINTFKNFSFIGVGRWYE
jgi:hypothetical protein